MIVTVQFLGRVETITKRKSEEVRIKEKSTISDLMAILAKEYGGRFKTEILDPVKGELRSEFVVMLNRKLSENLKTPLREGDTVVLMPVMSGG
jgi:MoaD family protein